MIRSDCEEHNEMIRLPASKMMIVKANMGSFLICFKLINIVFNILKFIEHVLSLKLSL